MDNKQVTAEWIAQQRAVCEAATPGPWVAENAKLSRAVIGGTIELLNWVRDKPFYTKNDFKFITAARTALPAALDALEASMAREAEKDATIARLTAERDAAIKDAALSKRKTCASRENCYVDADCDICIDWQWRGLCALQNDEKEV